MIAVANPVCSYRPIAVTPTCRPRDQTYIVVVATRHGFKGMNMQTAQINSPRFSYQAAAPTVPNTLKTLDDFRPVHGSYAGSFSGKSRQPIWIAIGMIVVVAGIAAGVNMYSASHTAKIESVAPRDSAFVAPDTPAATTKAPEAVDTPVAKQIITSDAPIAATKASQVPAPAKATISVTAKPAPAITKKVAPLAVEPVQMVAPPALVPATPPIEEPVPAPLPIMIEKPITPVPAPAPAPEVPPVEPK